MVVTGFFVPCYLLFESRYPQDKELNLLHTSKFSMIYFVHPNSANIPHFPEINCTLYKPCNNSHERRKNKSADQKKVVWSVLLFSVALSPTNAAKTINRPTLSHGPCSWRRLLD